MCSHNARPPRASPPVLTATSGRECTHFTDKETEARGGGEKPLAHTHMPSRDRLGIQTDPATGTIFLQTCLLFLPLSLPPPTHPSPANSPPCPLHSSPGILLSSSPLLFSHFIENPRENTRTFSKENNRRGARSGGRRILEPSRKHSAPHRGKGLRDTGHGTHGTLPSSRQFPQTS